MMPNQHDGPKWVTPVTEYGPLLLFFISYFLTDLITATGILVASTLAALAVSWIFARRIPWLPLLMAVVLSIFGGLTLVLEDDFFIKIKPTVMQVLFAAVLLGGLWVRRLWLKMYLHKTWPMPDRAWGILTKRLAVFFLFMALANEIVWRGFSTDVWVTFDTFGQMAATMLFLAAQFPFMQRHYEGETAAAVAESEGESAPRDPEK